MDPVSPPSEVTAFARIASGRLDRVDRLLDREAAARRTALLEVARAVYADPDFEPAAAAKVVLEGARARSGEARKQAERELEALDLPQREAEQRVRRAARGAEREEILLALDELSRVVPRPRRGRARAPPRWRSTPTGSTSCERTARASGCSAPRRQPSAFARPGDCSRSCSYRPGSRSRRSSFG